MKRLREFDVLKGLAITAVIIIHTTSDGTINFDKSSYSYFIYLTINRLSQFAVPTFLFASCVLLSYIHRKDFRIVTVEKLKTFYSKRFIRIVPPYMIWTLIYLVIKNINSNGSTEITLKNYFNFLLKGDGYYHLYFVIIILQIYIFLPYIIYLVSHLNIKFRHIFLISVALQVAFYYIYRSYIIHYFQRSAVLMLWYTVLILMGVWIGINYETYCKKERYIIISLPVALISGILYIYLYHLSNISQPISSTVFNLVWYIYVTSAALLLLYISKKIKIKFFDNAGQLSFGIYLMHPLFLFIMGRIFTTGNIIIYNIYVLVEFFVVYFVSYKISKRLEPTMWGKYIVG